MCEPASGRPSWPADLHPAPERPPPFPPFRLASTGKVASVTSTQTLGPAPHASYPPELPLQLVPRLLLLVVALPERELCGPPLRVQLILQLAGENQVVLGSSIRSRVFWDRGHMDTLGCRWTQTWALVRLMSSLICWDTRMASWAPVTLDWLNWTHSSGVEDLQQDQNSDEVLCWCQQQGTRVSSIILMHRHIGQFTLVES